MPELRFDGMVAIVTGAGAGLGREYARKLGERGASVIVNGRIRDSGESPAAATVEAIVASGGLAVLDTTSIGGPGAGEAIVARAVEQFGRLDIVVNNAAAPEGASLAEVCATDIAGAYDLAMAAWPVMAERRYGRIVNTTSNVGLLGFARDTHHVYAIAKAAMLGLTKNLAAVGRDCGIGVNAISPIGFTRRIGPGLPDEYVDWMRTNYPVELVAPVVLWLAHPNCDLTGEVLSAGGGRVSRIFIANTQGFVDRDLDLESVDANIARIMDASVYHVPATNAELHAISGRMIGVLPPPLPGR